MLWIDSAISSPNQLIKVPSESFTPRLPLVKAPSTIFLPTVCFFVSAPSRNRKSWLIAYISHQRHILRPEMEAMRTERRAILEDSVTRWWRVNDVAVTYAALLRWKLKPITGIETVINRLSYPIFFIDASVSTRLVASYHANLEPSFPKEVILRMWPEHQGFPITCRLLRSHASSFCWEEKGNVQLSFTTLSGRNNFILVI